MSNKQRSLPNPTVGALPDAAPPPDLSGGGDVMEAPAEGRSTRPGPQPKVIRETFSNPSIAPSVDVKLLNERKYDAARSKVRAAAVEAMPDLSIGTRLPGPPLPTEEGDRSTEGGETTEVSETTDEPALDAATAAQLAEKDRENRTLRKKMRAIEASGQSDARKLTQLKELAKTNPKGVAEYLGVDFQTYLRQVQTGEGEALKLDEAPAVPTEDDETTKLRRENEELRAREAGRSVQTFTQKLVSETRDDAGKLKYPRIARVGEQAIRAVVEAASREAAKMRKLTPEEGQRVLEHFLAEKEQEYTRAGAGTVDAPRGQRQPPNPRAPQKVPAGSPMQMRHAKDESDPRNRPTSREIAARLRAKLVG